MHTRQAKNGPVTLSDAAQRILDHLKKRAADTHREHKGRLDDYLVPKFGSTLSTRSPRAMLGKAMRMGYMSARGRPATVWTATKC